MPRDDAALLDIVRHAREVLAFLEDSTFESFLADTRLQAAVMYKLVVIGEASRRLSLAFRTDIRDVPWVKIGNLRNVIVHEYHGVDMKKIWGIALVDLPALVDRLTPLLPSEDSDEPE